MIKTLNQKTAVSIAKSKKTSSAKAYHQSVLSVATVNLISMKNVTMAMKMKQMIVQTHV